MDYTKWTSKNGSVCEIKDMSTKHIRNCMYMLIRSINKDFDNDGKDTFDNLWTEEHAQPYLDTFYYELVNRNKTVNKHNTLEHKEPKRSPIRSAMVGWTSNWG